VVKQDRWLGKACLDGADVVKGHTLDRVKMHLGKERGKEKTRFEN